MKKKYFPIGVLMIGVICVSTFGLTHFGKARSVTLDITDYYYDDGLVNELKEYADLAYAYMEMAQDYADAACDEAEAALEARAQGDYEAFEEHMQNAQAYAEAAEEAADNSQAMANAAVDIASAAGTDNPTVDTLPSVDLSGIDLSTDWISDYGLGNSYDFSDITTIWDILPNWDAEDLMGIYTDPTWGMENIPTDWEFEIFVDPDYWGTEIIEEYYGTGNDSEYYIEATDFYENLLVGEDLTKFQEDAGYHDFLVNVYVNSFVETPAYQAAITQTYTEGYLSFDAYGANIAGNVEGFDSVLTETLSADYWSTASPESYFDSGSTDADYLAAVEFYEASLSGADLTKFQTNEAYHNYLVNSYIESMNTNNFESNLMTDISSGAATYDTFNASFTDTSMFDATTMTNTKSFNTMQSIYNFNF